MNSEMKRHKDEEETLRKRLHEEAKGYTGVMTY
jgi:hypothetical protein